MTAVTSAATWVRSAVTRATPVMTRWVRPESRRRMRAASAGVFGLAQDVVVESDCGIGSQDGESVRGLEYGGIF